MLSFYLSFFFLMIRRPPRSTRTDHSFPTRRSSDLRRARQPGGGIADRDLRTRFGTTGHGAGHALREHRRGDPTSRSEEHTSELQSLMRISYAVFCLKKKNTSKNKQNNKQKTFNRDKEKNTNT